ncbi:hypothetical protein F0L17_22715 [Streptomyces sp. TRM43335]|uniref:Uncharacterized protein n=1 Tax=Streptomyces taklimakanensis TaxID=2569853 RepID=A0A6G2BHX2_9ACTN|nr:hypothetical protein [Streptomyces taklimakanensis]
MVAAGAVAVASTPVVWLLGDPDTGQMVGASVQAGVGIVALLMPMLRRSDRRGPQVEAVGTGKARASGGGSANSGVRLDGNADPVSARAERTGDAVAESGGHANSGITKA